MKSLGYKMAGLAVIIGVVSATGWAISAVWNTDIGRFICQSILLASFGMFILGWAFSKTE